MASDLLNFDVEMDALFEEEQFERKGDFCLRIYALSELTSLDTLARLRTCVKTLDEKDMPDKTMVTLSGVSGGALQFLLDKGTSWVDIVSREVKDKGNKKKDQAAVEDDKDTKAGSSTSLVPGGDESENKDKPPKTIREEYDPTEGEAGLLNDTTRGLLRSKKPRKSKSASPDIGDKHNREKRKKDKKEKQIKPEYSENLFINESLSPRARKRDKILYGKDELDYVKPGVCFGIVKKEKKSILKQPLSTTSTREDASGQGGGLEGLKEGFVEGQEQQDDITQTGTTTSTTGDQHQQGNQPRTPPPQVRQLPLSPTGATSATATSAPQQPGQHLQEQQSAEGVTLPPIKQEKPQTQEQIEKTMQKELAKEMAKKQLLSSKSIVVKDTSEKAMPKAPTFGARDKAAAMGRPITPIGGNSTKDQKSVEFKDLDEEGRPISAGNFTGQEQADSKPKYDTETLTDVDTSYLHKDWNMQEAEKETKKLDKLKPQPKFGYTHLMCMGVHEFHHGLRNLETCIESYLRNTTHNANAVMLNSNLRCREGGVFDSPVNILPKYHVETVGPAGFRIGFLGLVTPDTRFCALSTEVSKRSAVTMTATSTSPAVRLLTSGRGSFLNSRGADGDQTEDESKATNELLSSTVLDQSPEEVTTSHGGSLYQKRRGGMMLQRSSSTLLQDIGEVGSVENNPNLRLQQPETGDLADIGRGPPSTSGKQITFSPNSPKSRRMMSQDQRQGSLGLEEEDGVFWLPNDKNRGRGQAPPASMSASPGAQQETTYSTTQSRPSADVDKAVDHGGSSADSYVNPQEAPTGGNRPMTPDDNASSSSRGRDIAVRRGAAGLAPSVSSDHNSAEGSQELQLSGSGQQQLNSGHQGAPARATEGQHQPSAAAAKTSKRGAFMSSMRSGSSLSLDEPLDLPVDAGSADGADRISQDIDDGGLVEKPADVVPAQVGAKQKRLQMRARSGSSILDEPFDQEIGGAVQESHEQDKKPTGASSKRLQMRARSGSSILDEPFDQEIGAGGPVELQQEQSKKPTGAASKRLQMRARSGSSILDDPFDQEIGAQQDHQDIATAEPSAPSGNKTLKPALSGQSKRLQMRARSGSSILDEPFDQEVGAAKGDQEEQLFPARPRIFKSIEEASDEADQDSRSAVDSGSAARSGKLKQIEWASDVRFGSDDEDARMQQKAGTAIIGTSAASRGQGNKRKIFTAARSGSSLLDVPYDLEIGVAPEFILMQQQDTGAAGSGSATVPSTQQNAKRRMFGTGATRSGSSLALDEPYDVEIGGPVLGPPNQPQQAAAKRRAMMRARSGSSVLDEPYDVEIGAAGVGAAAALTKAALAKKATFDSIQEEDQEDRPGSAPGAAGGGMVSSGQQATTGAGAPGGTKSRRSAFLTNKATRSGSSLQLDEPFDVEIDEGQPALDKDADAGEQPTLGGGARRRALFDKRRSGSSVLDEPYDEEVAAELQTGADQQKPSSFAKRGRMLSGGRSGTLSNLAEIDEGDEEQRSTESSGQQSGKKRFGPSRSIEWAPDVVFDKDNADEQNGDNTEPGEQQQLSGPPGGKRRSFAGATRSSSSLMLDDPYDVEIDQGQLDAADELTTTTAPRQARPKQGMKSLRTRSGSSLMLDEPYDIEVLGGDQPHSTSKPSVGETKRSSFGRRAQTGSSTALQKIEEGKDEDQEFLDAFADETEEVIGAAGVSGTKRGAFRVSKSIEWAADVQFGQQEEDRAGQEELDGTTVLNPAAARKRRFMAARSGSSLLDEPFDVEVLEHQGPLSAAAAGGMKQEQQMKRKKFMSARSGSSLLDPAFDEEVPLEIGELDTLAPVMDPKKASGTQQQQMRSKAFRQGRSGSSLALDEPFEVLDETKELQGVDFFPLYPVREDTAEQQTTPGQHQDRRLAPILKKKQSGSTQDQESASDSMSQSSKIQGGTTSAEQQSKLFGAQNNKSSSSTTGGGPHAKISADQIGTADDQDQPLLEFQETRCAANEVVGQALKRTSAVDAVIALTHQSTAEDKELMRTEPDIDILLGGFEREPLEWYVDENGKSLGQEWDPVIQKFIAIQGPDRLAVKPGPDAVSVLDLWLVPDNDEVLQQDAPRPPIGDTEEDEITEFDDEQLTEVMTPDQKLLQKMNRFPTVEQRSPRWNQQRTMPSRTGRRLVIGRHRHVKLVPTRAHMKDYDEKGFEPDEEFSTMLHKYQKFLNLENMNLLQWTDYDDRLAKVASCEEDSFDRMREMALAEYISLVQRMDRGRKLGRNTTEDEIKALRAVENVIAAGRPTVHEESVCSGTDNSRRPNWTTKDAEWRQCTFHSLVADLVLPELVGADARDRTLLLLPATHYLSFVSGGKDYGLDDPRFTRYELLKEFIPPIIDDFPEGTPASERNRPKDLSNQKRAELRLVRLKISGLDLLKLLYESEAFLRGTNSYLQYDHSAICINDFTDLNLPKISDKDMKRNKFPGFPGKKKKMKSAGGNASSYAPSTAGDVETHTGESTLAWREEQDRIEEEARLAALEKVEEEQIEEAFLSVMENARADRMEACGGVLGFPVSGDSSEISGYDPDERLEGWASSSEKAAAENKKDDDDNSENGDKSPGGSDSGGDMSGLDPDDDENKLSKSKEKDKIDLLDAESLLPSTESDHYDPNEMIKTKVPADFQILSVFGEQFDRSQFYQIVVPGTLLLHETAKPGDHRLVQPLIVGGQRKVRPRKRQKAQLEEEESSEDEDEKRRRYNAAPPVRDQVYNLLKDQVAPRQLGKESVKPIVENSPLLVELVLKHLLQDLWEDLSPFWSKSKKFTLGGLKPLPKDGDIDESKLPPIVRVRRRLHLIQQMQRGEKLYDMEDPIEVRKDKQMLEKLVNLLDSERDVAPEELVEILEKYQKDNVLANLDPRLLKRALNERLPAPMSKWATLRLQDEPSGTEESSSATGGERSGSGQEDGEKEKRPASGDQGSVAKSVGTGEKESSAGGDKDQKSESKSDSQSLKDSHSQKDSDSRSLSQSQSQRGSQSSKQVSSSATPGGTKGDTTTSAARQVEASAGRSRRSGASSKFSRDDELERIEEENVLARSRQSSKDAAETVVSSATGTTGAAGAMKEGTKPAKESTTPKDSHSASGRSTGTSRKTGRTRGSHKSGKEIDPNAYRGIEWNGVRIAKSLSPEREQKRRDLFFSDDTLVSELEKGMEQMARRMKFYKKQTPKELLYEMQKRADTGKLGRHLVFNMPLLSGSETELEKAREKIDPVMSTSELEM